MQRARAGPVSAPSEVRQREKGQWPSRLCQNNKQTQTERGHGHRREAVAAPRGGTCSAYTTCAVPGRARTDPGSLAATVQGLGYRWQVVTVAANTRRERMRSQLRRAMLGHIAVSWKASRPTTPGQLARGGNACGGGRRQLPAETTHRLPVLPDVLGPRHLFNPAAHARVLVVIMSG